MLKASLKSHQDWLSEPLCLVHTENLIWVGKKTGWIWQSHMTKKNWSWGGSPCCSTRKHIVKPARCGWEKQIPELQMVCGSILITPQQDCLSSVPGVCLKEAGSREVSSSGTQELFFWTAHSWPARNCPSWLELVSFSRKSAYSWALKLQELWQGLSKSAVKQ